jgi:CRP/FNR family cyclic AMP-dependent transcriptional regulator
MQTDTFSDIFPLFDAADSETLEWLLSVAVERDYPPGRAVLMEDAWGNAVYFIVSGWVKVRHIRNQDAITLAVLSRGDFFGEMAILDESPRSTDVVAYTPVRLLSIPAQRFIQFLFKDSQLHHRMLQLMVRRLRKANQRSQMRQEAPAVRIARVLVSLADTYGSPVDDGVQICNLPDQDVADLASVSEEESIKVMDKLREKGWIQVEEKEHTMTIVNTKQMQQLAGGR